MDEIASAFTGQDDAVGKPVLRRSRRQILPQKAGEA